MRPGTGWRLWWGQVRLLRRLLLNTLLGKKICKVEEVIRG